MVFLWILSILLFLLTILTNLPLSYPYELTNLFPPNITWANSVDSNEKLLAFLLSDHRMARQTVNLSGTVLIMGQNSSFTLLECLSIFLRVESDHFLQLHVRSDAIFLRVWKLLNSSTDYHCRRLGVQMNIQTGPNCFKVPNPDDYVHPNTFLSILKLWPGEVPIIFGFTTKKGPVNQYSKREMSNLYNALKFFRNNNRDLIFIVEFDAYYLSHKFNLLHNVEEVRRHHWLVLIYQPSISYAIEFDVLRKMIYFLGPENVYMNMPQKMRDLMAVQHQDPYAKGVILSPQLIISWLLLILPILYTRIKEIFFF